jgi:superfamily II DNA or RNA helicase
MSKIILGDKVYIPKKLLKDRIGIIKDNYERHVYNEKMCAKCENKPERYNDICATCVGHINYAKNWNETKVDGISYVGLPKGNLNQVQSITNIDFDKHKIVDMRSNVKMIGKIKWTGKLYTGKEQLTKTEKSINQVEIVKNFWKKKNGFIVAAPRSGKTLMATRIICAFKRRTLILVHEDVLAKQILKAIVNFTNIREQEKKIGKKLVGILQKRDKDLRENWDIVITNYQKFIHANNDKVINKYLRGKFGLLVIDEAHRAAAGAYSNLVSKLDTKYTMALSATPDRKDGMQWLCHQLIGPVVSKSEYKGMIPKVIVHPTKFNTKQYRGMAAYTYIHRDLSVNNERNKMLVRQVFQDLRENPNHNIIIPVLFIDHAKTLVRMINNQAMINNQKRKEDWPVNLATEYHGRMNRDKVLIDIKNNKIRVTVAIRKMVQEAIDVPAWTHMYLQFAMNNEAMFYQMTKRICTPYLDKPHPVLRFYVDDTDLSRGCFTATWWNGVIKNKYKISEDDANKAKLLISSRFRRPNFIGREGL